MIEAVLFDLDGVITDTARFHYQAWKKFANELGKDIDEEFNEMLKGVDRRESLKRLLKHIEVELDEEEFEVGMTRKNAYYVELLNNLSPNDILDGISEFIDSLREHGVKISIASASKNAPAILEKIGLLDKVDAIADPSAVKENKPAPDIFLLAADLVQVDYSNCVGIEDAQAGIDALNRAGIKSIAIGEFLENSTINLPCTSCLNYQILRKL